MFDSDFDPLKVLEELTYEMIRLNQRQVELQTFLVELADQHANIAEHLYDQQKQIDEIKQSTKTNC